jgi:hypothetical protein
MGGWSKCQERELRATTNKRGETETALKGIIRLAAEAAFDGEIALTLDTLADEIEHRAREADRRLCSPK